MNIKENGQKKPKEYKTKLYGTNRFTTAQKRLKNIEKKYLHIQTGRAFFISNQVQNGAMNHVLIMVYNTNNPLTIASTLTSKAMPIFTFGKRSGVKA